MVMNTTFSWPCFFLYLPLMIKMVIHRTTYITLSPKKVPYPQRIKHFYDYRDI